MTNDPGVDNTFEKLSSDVQPIAGALIEAARQTMPEAHGLRYHDADGYLINISPRYTLGRRTNESWV
jgi:hypothetical protein